jgi:hypothetical protein
MPPLGIDRFSIVNGDDVETINAVAISVWEEPDPTPLTYNEYGVAPGEIETVAPVAGVATKVRVSMLVGAEDETLELDIGPGNQRIASVAVGILDAPDGWAPFGLANLDDGSQVVIPVV